MTPNEPQLFLGMPITVTVAIISGLVTVVVSCITILLTQRYASKNLQLTLEDNQRSREENRRQLQLNLEASDKKHRDELTEKRTDRVFEAKLKAGSELLEALTKLTLNAQIPKVSEEVITNNLHEVKNLANQVSFLYSDIWPQSIIFSAENLCKVVPQLNQARIRIGNINDWCEETLEGSNASWLFDYTQELQDKGLDVEQEKELAEAGFKKQLTNLNNNVTWMEREIFTLLDSMHKELEGVTDN